MVATAPTASGIQVMRMFLAFASVCRSSQMEATTAAAMMTRKVGR